MTKRKDPTTTARTHDPRVRPVSDTALADYRKAVADRINELGARPGGPHWLRHERYETPTYSALYAGHSLTVWQADRGDWRVCLEVKGPTEICLAHTATSHAGREQAIAWAEAHDASLVRLKRGLHMGFWVPAIDEDAFLPPEPEPTPEPAVMSA